MDLFKRTNVIKATELDFNAKCVKRRQKSRKADSLMLSRYSRRKLKQKINEEIEK